jgi:hypothetical protein
VRRLAVLALLAGCPDPECELAWRAVADQDEAALLSVRGTAADDVWAVGGGLGLGGAVARHWDGASWRELAIDDARSLWWVWPVERGRAIAVGEGGVLVELGADGVVDVGESGVAATLYGIWGHPQDAPWLVGEGGVIVHGGVAVDAGQGDRDLYKVWGTAPGDVWVSGERGTLLHFDGAVWTDHTIATAAPVLTVDGCSATEVYAVAGQRLYQYSGESWTEVDVALGSVANGVACGASGVLVSGNGGLRVRFDRATEAWTDERLEGPWDTDYHAAWIDDAATAWAAGGNFNNASAETRRGVLAVRGCPGPAPW